MNIDNDPNKEWKKMREEAKARKRANLPLIYGEPTHTTTSSSSYPHMNVRDVWKESDYYKKQSKWKDKSTSEEARQAGIKVMVLEAQVGEAQSIIQSILDYIDYLSRQQPVDKAEKTLIKDMVESLTDILGELPEWVSTTTKS